MEVNIRPLKDSDKSFVYATMLRGLYHGNDFYNQIDKAVFFANYSGVIDRLLESATVTVATLPDDADVILAYVITSGSALHWAFTKKPFRKQGLVSKLLAGTEISCVTHLTQCGNMIRLNKQWAFNPFAI